MQNQHHSARLLEQRLQGGLKTLDIKKDNLLELAADG